MPSITYVQGAVNNAASATVSKALGSNITAGNLLVVSSKVENLTNNSTPASVSFSSISGVTLNFVQAFPSTAYEVSSTGPIWASTAIYTALIPSTGAETVQAAWSGSASSTFSDIAIAEYSVTGGVWANPVIDSLTSNSGQTSGVNPTAAMDTGVSSSTANANDLIVGIGNTWNVAETWGTGNTGYTQRANSSRNTLGWYDKLVSATGTQEFSTTLSGADEWIAVVLAFQISVGSKSSVWSFPTAGPSWAI